MRFQLIRVFTCLLMMGTAVVLATPKDMLLLELHDDIDYLNPLTTTAIIGAEISGQIYEPLARRNLNDFSKWDPKLAEKIEINEKERSVTVHLRKNVFWHPIEFPEDKELAKLRHPFTAADVLFTFAVLMNENTMVSTFRSFFKNGKGESRLRIEWDKKEPETLKFVWLEPYFNITSVLEIPILPQHVFNSYPDGSPVVMGLGGRVTDFAMSSVAESEEFAKVFNDHWANWKSACGTGPFRLKKWDTSMDEVELTRNINYWGKKPPFQTVLYRRWSNPMTAEMMTVNESVDERVDFLAISAERMALWSDVKLKSKALKKIVLPPLSTSYIGFNHQNLLFADKKVRQALRYAIDIPGMARSIYLGNARENLSILDSRSPYYDKSLSPYGYNPKRAIELLKEAGWSDSNEDGILDKRINGTLVDARFDLLAGADPLVQRITEILKDDWRKIGIQCDLNPMGFGLLLQKTGEKDFDAYFMGNTLDLIADPSPRFHGRFAELKNSDNWLQYSDSEMNGLLDQLVATVEEKEKTRLFAAIQKKIHEDQVILMLMARSPTLIADAELTGMHNLPFPPYRDLYLLTK
jgi:peptide/nickel transport system substrate-binding protein